MSKLIIVQDETEIFKKSTCDCDFCDSMHKSAKEWETFVPTTQLQKGMMKTVAKIEERSSIRSSPRIRAMRSKEPSTIVL